MTTARPSLLRMTTGVGALRASAVSARHQRGEGSMMLQNPGSCCRRRPHLHDGVQVELPGAQDGVLAALLYLGLRQGVALVDLPQPFHLQQQQQLLLGFCFLSPSQTLQLMRCSED